MAAVEKTEKERLHALLDVILDLGSEGQIQAIVGDLEVLSRAARMERELRKTKTEKEKPKEKGNNR